MHKLKTARYFFFLIAFIGMAFFSSCNRKILTVHTTFITAENLASFYVNTPDPYLNRPPFEQRLVVSWKIPKSCMETGKMELLIRLRLYDREEITKRVILCKPSGAYTLFLNQEQYCKTGGFLTYNVQLLQKGYLLDQQKHQLWSELITLDIEEG